jgi:quercetin dioxygenase-like cupin family protein
MIGYDIVSIGDAIFLPANEPHAYLAGDCIECMYYSIQFPAVISISVLSCFGAA